MAQEITAEKGDLVLVVWEDSMTDQGWEHPDDEEDTNLDCESVGWVISFGPKRLILGADKTEELDGTVYNRRMIIPRSIIKEIRKL